MDHSFPIDPAPDAALASPVATPLPPRRASRHRPLGWRCLDVTAIGGPPDARLRVNAVLLHPQHGIALIDLAPRSTPRAAEALRLTLAAWSVQVWPPADIPIAYFCLAPEEMRMLPDLLRAAIAQRAGQPTSPDRTWMAEVAAALHALERTDRDRTGALAASRSGKGRSRWRLPAVLAMSLGAGILGGLLIPRGPAPVAEDTRSDPGPGSAAGAVQPAAGAAPISPGPRPAGPSTPDRAGPIGAPAAPEPPPARPADAAGHLTPGADRPHASPPAPAPTPTPPAVAAAAGPAAARPQPRPEVTSNLARRPAATTTAPARVPASPLCAPLLARLQLGEKPSDADRALLRTACAPS